MTIIELCNIIEELLENKSLTRELFGIKDKEPHSTPVPALMFDSCTKSIKFQIVYSSIMMIKDYSVYYNYIM